MTTVTRKDIEQRVMALQSLAMECAKARTVEVFVDYSGHIDSLMVRAYVGWQPCAEPDFVTPGGAVPLSGEVMSPPQIVDVLAHAHKNILALHNEALATMKSEHGGEA